jgi:hypothetical protein
VAHTAAAAAAAAAPVAATSLKASSFWDREGGLYISPFEIQPTQPACAPWCVLVVCPSLVVCPNLVLCPSLVARGFASDYFNRQKGAQAAPFPGLVCGAFLDVSSASFSPASMLPT